jgi:dolichol-phosphate mannosyltransferase
MKISIILPTYCEKENIVRLIDALYVNNSKQVWSTEIIVVDDNSPDGTADAARTREKDGKVSVHCFIRNQERGLATAVLFGIHQSSGDIVVVMDTDFNHDPEMIPQMVKFMEYYNLIIGSRFVTGGGMQDRKRYFFSLVYNLFIRSLLRTQIQDNLSGFFAVWRKDLVAMDLNQIFTGYGEFFIRLTYFCRQRHLKILEIPAFYNQRLHGTSKSRFFGMILNYTRCVLYLWFYGKKMNKESAAGTNKP